MKRVEFNLSNKLAYTLISIIIFTALSVGVYAVAGVSHDISELPSIPWSKLTNIPAGFADGVDNGVSSWSELSGIPSGFSDGVDNTGVSSESDPTVTASVKDGVSWSELTGNPYIGKLKIVNHYFDADDDGWLRILTSDNSGSYKDLAVGNLWVNNALSVVGDISDPWGSVNIADAVYATAYYYSSDERLKKNIRPISNVLDKVLQLQGVSFEWKDESEDNKGKNLGFIAQDVEEIFPEVVRVGDNEEGMKSIEYGSLVAVLTEAIKEQQAEIEELKSEVEELKLKAGE